MSSLSNSSYKVRLGRGTRGETRESEGFGGMYFINGAHVLVGLIGAIIATVLEQVATVVVS